MSRILNRRQVVDAPMVDAGHLYLDEVPEHIEQKRVQMQMQRLRVEQAKRNAEIMNRERARRADLIKMKNAQMHGAMLERSLRQKGHETAYAAKRQGQGWVRQYGLNNPLLGFVDETSEPDFEQREVYEAQEFNNHLTARNNPGFLKNKDFPMVIDAPRGDFGGILTNDKYSADFSSRIVNDVKTDFGGYVPKPRRR